MPRLVISYSREDAPLVRSVVTLLRGALRDVEGPALLDDLVESDETWFKQFKIEIEAAPQLFVFWCSHASVSDHVRREYEYALKQKKRIVPVILDDTPLPAMLAMFHSVDLRGAVAHAHAWPVEDRDPLDDERLLYQPIHDGT